CCRRSPASASPGRPRERQRREATCTRWRSPWHHRAKRGRGVSIALFTDDLFHDGHAKTAHGILRFGTRDVVRVVDTRHAGGIASDVVPYAARPVPIVATVAEAKARGATTLVVGVAPSGGK